MDVLLVALSGETQNWRCLVVIVSFLLRKLCSLMPFPPFYFVLSLRSPHSFGSFSIFFNAVHFLSAPVYLLSGDISLFSKHFFPLRFVSPIFADWDRFELSRASLTYVDAIMGRKRTVMSKVNSSHHVPGRLNGKSEVSRGKEFLSFPSLHRFYIRMY